MHSSRQLMGLFALLILAPHCGSTNDSGLVGSATGGTPSNAGAAGDAGDGGGGSGKGGTSAGGSAGSPATGGAIATGGRTVTGTGGQVANGTGATPAGGAPSTACDSDNDCTPSSQLCDFTRGLCVDCLADAQCSGGLVCRAGECVVLTTCASSLDCAGASDGRTICDVASGECVECLNSPDCDPGYTCAAHRCTQGCVPATCGGQCGSIPDGCNGTLDCGSCTAHCANGLQDIDETGIDCGGLACPACPGPAGAWSPCTVDADCNDGRICTKIYQDSIAPGHLGSCVRTCTTPANCDPSPDPVSTTTCYFFGTSFCALNCGAASACPAGYECVGTFCMRTIP